MSIFPVKFAPVFDPPSGGLGTISHGFFGRAGGVSKGIYASLNTGQGSDDDPENVARNRQILAHALGTKPEKLLSLHQCHSVNVINVDGPWTGLRPQADALVTKRPGLAISALAADCAPVLFADFEQKIIGAAHAGWRGALAGVTDTTIAAMVDLGAKRQNIRAAVGPCIGAESFEVGPEFVARFLQEHPDNMDFVRPGLQDRSYFDIKSYLLRKLRRAGVAQVCALADCTYSQPDQYFSYRYNSHIGISDYGRNISAIMINV